MIRDHDPELDERKKLQPKKQALRFVGLKLNDKDLAKEVSMDLNLPAELVSLIIEQVVRRIVYHVVRDHELTFAHFGRFRLKRGQCHWVLQFVRMRSLDSYVNARLDNDQNKKTIVSINPIMSHSWYEYQILKRNHYKIKDIRPSDQKLAANNKN